MLKHLLTAGLLALGTMLPTACAIPSEKIAVSITVSQDPNYSAVKLLNEVALPTYKVSLSGGGSGSSVAISPTRLVTAAHVILTLDDNGAEAIEPKIYIFNKWSNYIAEAQVVSYNKEKDLAILEVMKPLPHVAKMLPEGSIRDTVKWGSPVVTCGNSLGVDTPIVGRGFITDVDDNGYIRYDAFSMPGNSGGPVFFLSGNVWHVGSISQQGYVYGAPLEHMGLGCNPFTLLRFLSEGR